MVTPQTVRRRLARQQQRLAAAITAHTPARESEWLGRGLMVAVYLLIGWGCLSLALMAPHTAGLDGALLVVAFVALFRACRWLMER